MDLELTSELWNILSSHIDAHERKDAAESLVAFMVDMGAEPDDIKNSFRGDSVVTKALKEYIVTIDEPEDEEDWDDGWGRDD